MKFINKEAFENFKRAKQKNKIIFLIILVILVLIILGNVLGREKVGNTIGNIRNYGYAAKSGRWIYFLSPNEDSSQVGIFKMKAGDEEQKSKKQLVMDEWDVLALNVYKDYLYFIGITSEAYSEEDVIDNKIYRMKTDGSGLEVINDNEFDNDCYEIYVIEDKIYYIGTDYNIYKMNLDGKERELVLENQTGYLGITDKYIIYNVENEDGTDYITYIADIDGKNARPIIENTRLYSVNVDGEYIYYSDQDKNILRVKVDGTDQQMIYETTAYNMNVSGKYIYYLNYADEQNNDYTICVYKIKKDGSDEAPEVLKRLETYSSFIDIVGDWIIYMDSSETEGFINMLKTDGEEEIKVYKVNFEEMYGAEEEEATEETEVEGETTVDLENDTESENQPEDDSENVTTP